ncbi:Hypothetical protein POVR1_LOCUS87 [uncultured virus]|nr:Hypothetical protein POVR1_LOCUS87 [uncultured virus]
MDSFKVTGTACAIIIDGIFDLDKLNSRSEIFQVVDMKFHNMVCRQFVDPITLHMMMLKLSTNRRSKFQVTGYRCHEDILVVINALKKYEVIDINAECHVVETFAINYGEFETSLTSVQDFRDYILTLEKNAALSVSESGYNELSFHQMGTYVGTIKIFQSKFIANGVSIAIVSQLYNLMNHWQAEPANSIPSGNRPWLRQYLTYTMNKI